MERYPGQAYKAQEILMKPEGQTGPASVKQVGEPMDPTSWLEKAKMMKKNSRRWRFKLLAAFVRVIVTCGTRHAQR